MAQHNNNNNRNSPHLNHLQNGSAPPSPSMSNSQQQPGQTRQPVSYPSPTSYPSPSLSSAQQYYPGQQDPSYRASPTGSNGSLSLPSMRSLDPLQQQQQAQHHMGSPLPPPVAQMGGPYYHNQGQTLPHPNHQYPNVTSDPTGQNMRYALPVTDARVMSGGRHKKEIKRRTKTGCLTCRKRRIKCDEQHPACRNCQKSKRECLGYDPIFKQQPGPAAIQPAPSSGPQQSSTSVTSNPYGNQPQMLQGSYGAQISNMGYEQALSASVGSPGSASQQFDYTSAIDPALEAASAPPAGSNNQYQQSQPAKRTINDLLALGGPPPPSSSADQTPQTIEETKHLYFSIYAPGLENFLETKWFSSKGCDRLVQDRPLLQQFATLLAQFAKTTQAQGDPAEIKYTSSVEARLVWALALLVRSMAIDLNGVKPESKSLLPALDDPIEAAHRLTIFEDLLTGRVAATNPLTSPVPGSADHHRLRELEFWYTLANFVCLRDDDPNSAKDIDDTLSALRNLLDGRENRDVLYSIAIIRAIGQRVSEYTEENTPFHLDESDNRSKLLVAKKFIQDEANGSGTTNVIRRLCELSTRTWTTPAPALPK